MSNSIIKKKNVFYIIMMILIGIYMSFIWWHSTLSADESSLESAAVLEFVTRFLKSIGFTADLTDHIIRKSAHFCEFALLGLLTIWCGWLKNHRLIRNFTTAGFVCLGTAVIDELVQIGSKGRSAEVTDVALDFCGAVSGVIFFIIIISIVKIFRKAK